jgi:3-hydroxyisobutyrate dehydrogenase-like beta-hydroxyacid dehydrogenase
MKIGFIGLGKMGSGMARNLLRAGHELAVHNRSREKAEALAGDGARVTSSPAEACRDREAVITMLSDDHAVEDIVFGKDGIASALKNGCAHISSSTISTALSRRLTSEHGNRGQSYLSAPVFGRPEAAEAKKLVVVVAGGNDAVERCRPLLDAIGRRMFVVGSEPWQANAVKLCGNFMIASMLEAFAETFAAMRKAGIDHHRFLEVMSELFGSPVYQNYGRIVADEQFDPAAFSLKLGLKDIRLVIDAAQELAAPMPLASLIRDHLVSGVAHGQADLDWSSLARVAARNAGLDR